MSPESARAPGVRVEGTRGYARPALMINNASGSASDIRDAARAIAAEFGMELRAEFLSPDRIADTVDDIYASGCDLFISYGGDGTSRASGERAAREGVPFIPLPGGTMNMLPKLLYGDVPWDHALRKAFMHSERWQPRGDAVGADGKTHSFLCGGFIGKATRINEVREEVRDVGEGSLVDTLGDAVEKLGEIASDVDADDVLSFGPPEAPRAHRANLLNIQLPGMGETAPWTAEFLMEVAGADVDGAMDLAGLVACAAGGDWRSSDNAVSMRVREAVVSHPDNCPHVLLDGEPIEMNCPVTLRVVPEGVRVLAPALADGAVRP